MARPILSYDDIPRELNLATYFVDRNVEEGRGDRTALIRPGGETTLRRAGRARQPRRQRAPRARRAGPRSASCSCSPTRSSSLPSGTARRRSAPSRRRRTRSSSEGLRVLPRLHAARAWSSRTRPRSSACVRRPAAQLLASRHLLVSRANSFEQLAAAGVRRARAGADHEGRRRDLEVHDGQHRAAEGGCAPAHSPLRSFEWYARGVLDLREDDVVLPVPKLFFGYARDLAALYPFGVGAAGIVFPERTTPERIFELIAAPSADDPRQRSDDDGGDGRPPAGPAARPVLPAPVHVGRRGAAARAARALATRRSASRCSTGSAPPRRTTSTSPTGPAAVRPGSTGKLVPGLRRARRRRGRRALRRRRVEITGRAPVLGRAREDEADLRRRPGQDRRPVRARRPTGTSTTTAAPTTCSRSAASGSRRRRSSTACSGIPTWSSARSSDTEENGLPCAAGLRRRSRRRRDGRCASGTSCASGCPAQGPARGARSSTSCRRTPSGKIDRRALASREPPRRRDRRHEGHRRGDRRHASRRPATSVDRRSDARSCDVTDERPVAALFEQIGAGRRARQQRRRGRERAARAHDARRLARAPRRQRDRRVPLHARRARRHDRARERAHRHRRLDRRACAAPATRRRTRPPSTPPSG